MKLQKLSNLTVIFLLLIIILIVPVASANSVHFSGLSQVNKSINVYDVNMIAAGQDGYVATINSTDTFYYTPGHSYKFEISPVKNTTFLSNAPAFADFFIGHEDRTIAIIGFLVLIVFALALLGGGVALIFMFPLRRG